ncbi:hypothetical protein BDV06DRAFT_225121 [Aspergillus oleicola]
MSPSNKRVISAPSTRSTRHTAPTNSDTQMRFSPRPWSNWTNSKTTSKGPGSKMRAGRRARNASGSGSSTLRGHMGRDPAACQPGYYFKPMHPGDIQELPILPGEEQGEEMFSIMEEETESASPLGSDSAMYDAPPPTGGPPRIIPWPMPQHDNGDGEDDGDDHRIKPAQSRYSADILTRYRSGRTKPGWYIKDSYVSADTHPHEVLIVGFRPDQFRGKLIESVWRTAITAMVERYKSDRPYSKSQKVMRRSVSFKGTFSGCDVVFRKSEIIKPDWVSEENKYNLFARCLASTPVGDTSRFPGQTSSTRAGKRKTDDAKLDDKEKEVQMVVVNCTCYLDLMVQQAVVDPDYQDATEED